MVVPRTDPTISLPGGGSGAFDTGVPTGGGGMSTNLLNSAPQSSSQEPSLFVGWQHGHHPTMAHTRPRGGGRMLDGEGESNRRIQVKTRTPVVLTPSQLLNAFDSFSRPEYLKFRNKMIAAGIVSENADPASVRSTYSSLLGDVASAQASGAQNMSPIDYINNLIRLNGLNPAKIGSAADYGLAAKKATTTTNTATSVYDLDPASARLMLQQTLQQKLGRDPSEAEVQDFIDAARTKATNHPSTSTTVYNTDANGNTTSNTTTASGFGADDAAVMADRRAKRAPDYKSYQAVSTYFPALQQALGATV